MFETIELTIEDVTEFLDVEVIEIIKAQDIAIVEVINSHDWQGERLTVSLETLGGAV